MSTSKLTLKQSNKKYGGFYQLVPSKKTSFELFKQFAQGFINLPYNIYQTIIGRLLSYLIINPLFRKDEKDESLILQHPRHPDPLFKDEDEMTIVNVYSSKHLFRRMLVNWHNFFVNHLTPAKWLNSIFYKIKQLLPSSETYSNTHLDKLVEKVEAQIKGENGKPFHPRSIHFRGIEKLSASQQEVFYQKLEERFGYDFRENRKDIYFYTLQTADNSILDSVEVRNQNATIQNIEERRFIIASMPRSNNFVDWLKHYKVYAKELNATIIAYNYRGVGASKGVVISEKELYADCYAQAQRLLKLGAKPENIAFMGECLGGNIATHTAGTLQEEGYPVKLFSARSFRSLTSIIEGRTTPSTKDNFWHPKTWLKGTLFMLAKFILSPIIKSAGWSLNVDKKFLSISPHDRDFLVVRSKKDAHGVRFADDLMIPHKTASTYSLVKQKTKELILKQNKGTDLTEVEHQWLSHHPREHKFFVSEKLHTNAQKANGHTVHPRFLVATNPKSETDLVDGRQYTLNFFKRLWVNQPNAKPSPRGTHALVA